MEKKYLRKILTVLCVMTLMGILLQGVSAEAASKKKKAVKAYKKFMEQSAIYPWGGQSAKWETSKCEFALAYIDNDAVPELVVRCYLAGSSNGYYALFTYINGKVSTVATPAELGISFSYYKKKGVFAGEHYYTHPQGGPGSEDAYYKMKKGKIASILLKGVFESGYHNRTKTEYLYRYYPSYSRNDPSGNWNASKDITRTQFNRKLKKLVGSAKITKNSSIKFKKNTVANRKKYLK